MWKTPKAAAVWTILRIWLGIQSIGAGWHKVTGEFDASGFIAGAFMNLNFLLAGTTSTNPIFYTVAVILLFTGSGAYYWGIDRFAIPYIKERMHKGEYGRI